jgi:hypothetical protein
MAFTQADLDIINQAIANGELEVQFPNGSRVRYSSMSDLEKRKAHIVKEMTEAEGNRRPRMTRLSVGKGI